MRIKKLLTFFFPTLRHFITSALIGISTAGFIYFGFLQRHFFSYRYLAYALIIAGIITLTVAWINAHFLNAKLTSLSRPVRNFTAAAAAILSIIFLFNIRLQPLYYLLPNTTLEIDLPIGTLPPDEEGVRLKWIETGQGYIPYTYIEYSGDWERVLGNTFFSANQSITLKWTGKVGTNTEIAFRKTAYDQPITVTWNGVRRDYNLRGSPQEDLLIQNEFKIRPVYFLPFIVSTGIAFFYWILLFFAAIGSCRINYKAHKPVRKLELLYYALPMLIVWLFILLILWPGVLTNDSLTIWSKAEQGGVDDWQSAFYTLFLSLLIRLNPSPAFILILQIISFALVVAWGLHVLQKLGLPRLVIWVISVIMALFPPNLLFSVTLWKDIPYAVSILALTIMLVEIVASKGAWGRKPAHWIVLGFTAFLISILRHNGAPSAFLSLLVLPLSYRKQWKPFLGSLLVAFLVYFLVKGPLYNMIVKENRESGQTSLIYLHHIGAHLDAGTEFTPEERDYLDQFLPLTEWEYSCCYVGTLSYDENLERTAFLSNTTHNRELVFSLFLRDPFVDISHALCAGELSYKFMNTQQCDHMKSLHGFISTRAGREDWIGEPNSSGLHEDSKFPALIQPLIIAMRPFGIFESNLIIPLRPAFWLLMAFIASTVWVLRADDITRFLPLLPILVQSLVLFLIGFAPAFRYYYSNTLVGILMIGYFFLPCPEVGKTK